LKKKIILTKENILEDAINFLHPKTFLFGEFLLILKKIHHL